MLWLGVAIYAVLIFVLGLDPRMTEYAHAIPFYVLNMGEWPSFTAPVQDLGALLWLFGQFADPAVSVWVVSYAPIFLGCAVAMFIHDPRGYSIVRHAARPYVLYPVILVLATLIAFRLPSLGDAAKQILVASVLVGVVLERRGIASTVLSWSPLRRIGTLSYALYYFGRRLARRYSAARATVVVVDAGTGAVERSPERARSGADHG
ncbi:MAG: hypothetical protein QOG76_6884 [Pseudonocardiales bacterium]|nr:hypothetical protein [Pseudonocardiales bacterium]